MFSLLGLLGFVPFILLLLAVFNWMDVPLPARVGKAYLLLVGVAWFLLNFFPCPRCKWPFAITWWYSLSVFAPRCVHCGLKKFSDGEE
jgi:membrane-anchored protein YejM (alkaline phosphatase superfamily)